MKEHHIFGMCLGIIEELPDGYLLVAHKNGPAIANRNSLNTLVDYDSKVQPIDETTTSVPYHVRHAAMLKYVRLTWPVVLEMFES